MAAHHTFLRHPEVLDTFLRHPEVLGAERGAAKGDGHCRASCILVAPHRPIIHPISDIPEIGIYMMRKPAMADLRGSLRSRLRMTVPFLRCSP
jgi:hypothetical protein